MFEICPKYQCTGCGACKNKCPKQCITMQEDEFGVVFPSVSESDCIKCGLCKRTCPSLHDVITTKSIKAYAGWSIDAEDRSSSTSGGISSVFCKKNLKDGGVVYGAVVNPEVQIHHIGTDKIEEAFRFKGSKYVQSEIGDCYREVLENLEQGRKVLFIGTPCQIAGLKAFLCKDYENLITIDLICHGVPPVRLLKEHLSHFVDIREITNISFRDKKGYNLKVWSGSKVVYERCFPQDSYQYGFSYSLFCRESCLNCKYSKNERCSDITIGDFWGLRNVSYSTEKVSLILVNTFKGEQFLGSCKNDLFLDQKDVKEAIKGNGQLNNRPKKHKYYNLFRSLYKRFGYFYAVKFCMIEFHIKYFIYRINRKLCT